MIATCIDHLKSDLAQMPEPWALNVLDRSALQQRLEALRLETIRLRPWDGHRYGVLALLFRLPDLLPETRIVLLNYLHSSLDFSSDIKESCPSSEIEVDSASDPNPPGDAPPPRPMAAGHEPQPSPPIRPESPAGSFKRPDDLFDRFLDWVAALVS
jgi:hypothetical protein